MSYANNPHPATSPNCPICHTCEDGAGHILAGCPHKIFKGLYIKRHDEAVRLIHKTVSKGAFGSHSMVMDAGKTEDLPRGVIGKKLPPWLRPSSISQADWKKMRPDLAILPVSRTSKEIWLLELGYCSDTNHLTKYISKHEQHIRLVDCLKQAGYKVHYSIITIGTTGTIPTTFLNSMTEFGLDRLQALKLADKIHAHTIVSFQAILQCRRVMEAKPSGT
jgi:hypothetical protein